MSQKKRIVVIGAGFGGLEFAKNLHTENAELIVIDRRNHHLFQPLLYQVASAGLAESEIAQPIRAILHDLPNTTVYLDEVSSVNVAEKKVIARERTFSYDYLVLAAGGKTSYFGNDQWSEFAPGLKTIDDALSIRQKLLSALEEAENTTSAELRKELLTFVVVGGGPTGVETAGAFAELAKKVIPQDFNHVDTRDARIILIEAAPRIMGHLPEDLSAHTKGELEKLGVDVRVGAMVKAIRQNEVELADGTIIRSAVIVWSAGVAASPVTRTLGVPVDRGGRIEVSPDLSVPGHPEIFAIGDLAFSKGNKGKPVPGVSPGAIQMGAHAAKVINAELASGKVDAASRPEFKYFDKGTMATIGRSKAVVMIGNVKFHGFFAWVTWLFVHLIYLVGFRNRLAVLLQWGYSYIRYKHGARIITDNYSASVQGRPKVT
ncbi:NADH dehydrogenase [Verrucomicrobium sp. GAS474]|uniref:NAD(P)/FAD-dependent oxidoreductase n=1 Tax=Verrucomicrobium sp. GAS474 TaxID=1882831 RepID=UPI00087DF46C|nr:NAD(P)/FAD-dependent oxidoreductase [Verrucomicrobium sp. GAS474]SDU22097.1 NADH dehydrogenase [Verrucomicrobium sp. GAS474]